MHKCEHCGSTLWFKISDSNPWSSTADITMALTIFWRCPVCEVYNAIPSMISCSFGEIANGYEAPAETSEIRIPLPERGADPTILAQFTDEQIQIGLGERDIVL